MKIAAFVGTFDPFTNGHASIVKRSFAIFDRLVIGVVGDNVNKPNMTPAKERAEAIKMIYSDDSRIDVKIYNGLTVDFVKEVGACCIVKGVRTMADLDNERAQADMNRMLGDVETVLFISEPQLQSVSSSMVRELQHFGKDVKQFVPRKKGFLDETLM